MQLLHLCELRFLDLEPMLNFATSSGPPGDFHRHWQQRRPQSLPLPQMPWQRAAQTDQAGADSAACGLHQATCQGIRGARANCKNAATGQRRRICLDQEGSRPCSRCPSDAQNDLHCRLFSFGDDGVMARSGLKHLNYWHPPWGSIKKAFNIDLVGF